MTGRLSRLFQRYADRHLTLAAPGRPLADGAGRPVGRVDRILLQHGRLIVEGQATADRVTLHLAGQSRSTTPEVRGGGGQPAFQIALPFGAGVPRLILLRDGADWPTDLPPLPATRLALARLALLPGFVWRAARALPSVLRWFRHRDFAAWGRVKRLLDLDPLVVGMRLDAGVLPGIALPAPAGPVPPVSIVMPVFNGLALLPGVLDRVLRHTDRPWRLILVEDASTDPGVRPFLRDWIADLPRGEGSAPDVSLIECATNGGFVAAANLGLAAARAAAPEDPVILLNADAFVPPGWASRLIAPLVADPTVASVTPMSNDAELATVPVICRPGPLRPGAAERIDAAARSLDPLVARAEAPTGVGFCMALSPRFLDRLPAFDTAFGRGYGEEVDWCRKAAALGGRHLVLAGLFVEHRGGTSFGSAAKQALLRQNGALISARYPRFDTDVQRFIADDPLLTARLALGLAWAAAESDRPVPVYLAHGLGGGAEHDLTRRIAADIAGDGADDTPGDTPTDGPGNTPATWRAVGTPDGQGAGNGPPDAAADGGPPGAPGQGAAVVLRVGGAWRWQIELHSAQGVTRGATDDTDLLGRLVGLLPARRLIYSCGVGDADPVALPGLLCDLAAGQPIEVLLHDYFPLSPSYTLLDSDGAWRGVPRPGDGRRGHDATRPDGRRVDLAEWQAAWGRLIAAAGEITVFSGASRDLLLAVWPAAADRVRLRPHRRPAGVAATALQPAPLAPRPVIGVLGNIGAHKGAAVVAALGPLLAGRGGDCIGLVVIGDLDPAYALRPPARIHGAYRPEEIPALARRHGITHWLIPSVWPETFSFTTHEALATGLPVIAFALGAQGEAVAAAIARGASGMLLPLPPTPRAAAMAVRAAVMPDGSQR